MSLFPHQDDLALVSLNRYKGRVRLATLALRYAAVVHSTDQAPVPAHRLLDSYQMWQHVGFCEVKFSVRKGAWYIRMTERGRFYARALIAKRRQDFRDKHKVSQ